MSIDLTTTGAVIGIIVGLVTIASAVVVGLRWAIRAVVAEGLHENNVATREVLTQVKNTHKTNLRQDIDDVMHAATSARFAADDAKELAASATAAIHRTERKVTETAGALREHIEFSEGLISSGSQRESTLVDRTEVLEKAVSDLSAAIKTVSTSTPLQEHAHGSTTPREEK